MHKKLNIFVTLPLFVNVGTILSFTVIEYVKQPLLNAECLIANVNFGTDND